MSNPYYSSFTGSEIDQAVGSVLTNMSNVLAHLANTSNPHQVTVQQIGALSTSGGTITVTDLVTSSASTLLVFKHDTPNVVASGFGSRILFRMKTDAGIERDAAAIDVVWNPATDSSSRGLLLFRTKDNLSHDMFGDAVVKTVRIGFPHYNTAQQPAALMTTTADDTGNYISIGGGSSSLHAVTWITLYTAPNGTTPFGTRRLTILGDGQMLFNINPPQTSAYYLFNAPTTAGSDTAFLVQRTYTNITTDTFVNQTSVTFSPTANNSQTLYNERLSTTITGTVTKASIINHFNRVSVTGTGAISAIFGYVAYLERTVAGTITNYRAFQIQTPVNTGGGTITNVYAYSCQEMKGTGVTNAWSLYSEGANTNMYHAGQVRIGSASDLGVGILQVTGDLAFNGARTIRTTTGNLTLQTDAGNGDVIINPHGTGRLRFGTFVSASVTLDGYIEIKDSTGTTRRLAVVT
jgi:hypothetical protein